MLTLDTLEKLSKIIFGGVGAAVVGYAGMTVQWDMIGIEQDRFCIDFASTAEAAMLRQTETIPSIIVERYTARCEVTPQEATDVIAETAAIIRAAPQAQPNGYLPVPIWEDRFEQVEQGTPDDPSEPTAPTAPVADGFVAIGRVQATAYGDVNFDIAASGSPAITEQHLPEAGDILQARWSVNLRGSTALTTSGLNPSIGLIASGECVAVTDAPDVARGQYWAPVVRTGCPSQ